MAVYRLPMRNWNANLGDDIDYSKIKFIDYLWGIETYKILAWIGIKNLFIDYLWGIETSVSSGCFFKCSQVYRLPMRNWNQSLNSMCVSCCRVYRLPMRNWNSERSARTIKWWLSL
mgnify:CR=1 FL=1